MELEAVNYGIGATVMEPGFDMLKAAMVSWLVSLPKSYKIILTSL